MSTMPVAMNGMAGIQLPFPFFPPFGCDTICQPIQLQVIQQVQETATRPAPTTQAPTTNPPTTMPPPKPTTPAPKPPAPTTTTYTSQAIIMYPNWCQGWCRFFYQPPPQPVYYQPNCLLFSWMGLGSGMAMGMPTTTTHS
ncbi:keratin, type II cytoskeletal 1-like [Aphis craccivora]|uniref:Keratin, type II cytoskeletal 1-like n=1 Tax=Aphis craccivora TaxID=307492 RepID=A0A6G0ZCG7_APHCR|nr:keratin, type II cytoskeletal 1-like [Aphis craccivora]